MVSSKLSGRRSNARTPTACHPPPPPPIVPPPPPPTWPADPIHTHLVVDWIDWDGPHHLDVTVDVPRVPGSWIWEYCAPEQGYELWICYDIHEAGHVALIWFYIYNGGTYASASIWPFPIVWDTYTSYHISSWDNPYPPDLTANQYFSI